MSAAAQPQPNPAGDAILRDRDEPTEPVAPDPSAADRLERLLGRELAEVLVRGLARRLR